MYLSLVIWRVCCYKGVLSVLLPFLCFILFFCIGLDHDTNNCEIKIQVKLKTESFEHKGAQSFKICTTQKY